jgi:hypothetical protein
MLRSVKRGLTVAALVATASVCAAAQAEARAATHTAPRQFDRAVFSLRLAFSYLNTAALSGVSRREDLPLIQSAYTGDPIQTWYIQPITRDRYEIKSAYSGLCVTANGNDDYAPITQRTCQPLASQQWWFVSKQNFAYQVVDAKSGMCLNVSGGAGRGRALILYTCSSAGEENDLWVPTWLPDQPTGSLRHRHEGGRK